jgi:MinD-like ATPase involved in chromosome partitioning or flagellar assembly
MTIVTFYSYKGGVGRSMALANVAAMLAWRGNKVLAIDWDLEAPGLEEYFNNAQIETAGRGLLDLLINKGEYSENLWHVHLLYGEGAQLDLLPSGRDEESYYHNLERFNQQDFFENKGGVFLEELRNQWLRDYDFVLVDSRTGLSDSSGICTIFLPDIVVGLFTATHQSVRGTRDVLQLARIARQRLDFDRSQFSVIPVPCRMDASNSSASEEWVSIFESTIGEFLDDWKPTSSSSTKLLMSLAVPQEPELAFGTRILEPIKHEEAKAVKLALGRLSQLIESRLSDLSSLELDFEINGPDSGKESGSEDGAHTRDKWNSDLISRSKPIKVFLSFSRGGRESEWIETLFLPTLMKIVDFDFHHDIEWSADFAEISSGDRITAQVIRMAEEADVMLVFLSKRYLQSSWARVELTARMEADSKRGHNSIVPVALEELNHISIPQELRYSAFLDMSSYYGLSVDREEYLSTQKGRQFFRGVSTVAKAIIQVSENSKEIYS